MILVCALLLDLGAGEPRNFWHPVAWIGGVLDRLFGPRPAMATGLGFSTARRLSAVWLCRRPAS